MSNFGIAQLSVQRYRKKEISGEMTGFNEKKVCWRAESGSYVTRLDWRICCVYATIGGSAPLSTPAREKFLPVAFGTRSSNSNSLPSVRPLLLFSRPRRSLFSLAYPLHKCSSRTRLLVWALKWNVKSSAYNVSF